MLTKFTLALEEVISHLKKLTTELNVTQVRSLIDLILSSDRVFVFGVGRSGYMARAFAQRLMQIGKPTYFIGETITPSATEGDLLLVVSGSGKTPSVLAMLVQAKTLKLKRALVTTNPDSPAAELSNLIVRVPGTTKLLEKATHAPFTSLFDIATLTVLDSITAELMDELGTTDLDIQKNHANLE